MNSEEKEEDKVYIKRGSESRVAERREIFSIQNLKNRVRKIRLRMGLDKEGFR